METKHWTSGAHSNLRASLTTLAALWGGILLALDHLEVIPRVAWIVSLCFLIPIFLGNVIYTGGGLYYRLRKGGQLKLFTLRLPPGWDWVSWRIAVEGALALFASVALILLLVKGPPPPSTKKITFVVPSASSDTYGVITKGVLRAVPGAAWYCALVSGVDPDRADARPCLLATTAAPQGPANVVPNVADPCFVATGILAANPPQLICFWSPFPYTSRKDKRLAGHSFVDAKLLPVFHSLFFRFPTPTGGWDRPWAMELDNETRCVALFGLGIAATGTPDGARYECFPTTSGEPGRTDKLLVGWVVDYPDISKPSWTVSYLARNAEGRMTTAHVKKAWR